jgi:hypothetical protein
MEFVEIYGDEVRWRSSRRGAVGNRINQVNLGNFSASDLAIVKNTEATRFMPDTVDLATARLDVDRKSAHHDRAELKIFDDHIQVMLAHQRAGAGSMDVTVKFGRPP